MAILLDENTEVMIQGITGREATIRAGVMKGYGTKVVCGVTPGRGGMEGHSARRESRMARPAPSRAVRGT